MTLRALMLLKKAELSPVGREQDHTGTVYGEPREAAMNDHIEMLFVTPLAVRSRASSVIV
ncbi:hypothetical protein [Rhizobium aethiopicum]|uniref:hypothetical protein n=1 Tax=Rhizobium aethiopicum TaxID=1138170 RepID=UPI000B8196B5|nr:hypothetical protein [Rhizobium aethiopicum]